MDVAARRGGLTIRGLSKSYGATKVLEGVDLTVEPGSFYAVLGPSGSGKTTVLRTIAGFVAADSGTVEIDGHDMTGVAPAKRDLGVVFQSYALFPHMTVAQNVAYGLKMRRVRKDERRERVAAAIALVGLQGMSSRFPGQLSGGQQQRVALARALVIRPRVLLLDEPLSALDRKVRQEMREELRRIHAETGVTSIIVTHDQEEAMFLADQMLVLKDGQVLQSGPPRELYYHPADDFVAGFLGQINRVPIAGLDTAPEGFARTDDGHIAARPEELLLRAPDAAGLAGHVREIEWSGPVAVVGVELEGGDVVQVLALTPELGAEGGVDIGSRVRIGLRPRPATSAVAPSLR